MKRSLSPQLWTPWLVAAIVATTVPPCLGLLETVVASPSWSAREFYPYGFGPIWPLHGRSLLYVQTAAAVHGCVGVTLAIRWRPRGLGLRGLVSHALAAASLALLLFLLPLLSVLWTLAITGGHARFGAWGTYTGNHGPWRHVYNLRRLLGMALQVPIASLALGALSALLSRSRRDLCAAGWSVCAWVGLLWTHYWLID